MDAIRAVQADRTRWEIFDQDKVVALAESQEQADQLVNRLQALDAVKPIIRDLGPLGDVGSTEAWEAMCEIESLLADRGLYDPVEDEDEDEDEDLDEG